MRKGMEALRFKGLAAPRLDDGNAVQQVSDRAHEPAVGRALLSRDLLAFDCHTLAGNIQREHQYQRDRAEDRAPDEHHDDRANHLKHHWQQTVQRPCYGADDGFHIPGNPGNDVALPPLLLIGLVGLQRPRHSVVAQRFDDTGRQHGIRMTVCEADRMLQRVHNAEEHKVQREAGPQNGGEDAASGGEKVHHRCDDLDGEQTQPCVDHGQEEDQQDRGPFRLQIREQAPDPMQLLQVLHHRQRLLVWRSRDQSPSPGAALRGKGCECITTIAFFSCVHTPCKILLFSLYQNSC